jgi:hypothetical protein
MSQDAGDRDLVEAYRALVARAQAGRLSSAVCADHWRRLYRSFCPQSDPAEEDQFVRDVAEIVRCAQTEAATPHED